MKKVLSLLTIIFVVCAVTGCGSRVQPEKEVAQFFDSLKVRDESVLGAYTNYDRINVLLHSKGKKSELERMYTFLFQNFSYKILSMDEDNQVPTVTVEISNSDFSKVIKNYEKKAYNYTIDNLYSKKVNKKNLNAKCLKIFVDEIEKASQKKSRQTNTVVISLEPNDFSGWTLILTDEVIDTIMGGLNIPFKKTGQ